MSDFKYDDHTNTCENEWMNSLYQYFMHDYLKSLDLIEFVSS